MKRFEAPSQSNSSFKKKMKADVAVRITPSLPKVAEVAQTSLTAKQLKSLQYLLSAAAYATVIEAATIHGAGLREKCYKHDHGYDEEIGRAHV